MDALDCVDSSWLTTNPLLDRWLHAACQDPDTFVPIVKSLSILNEAEMLQEYHISVKIYRMLIADSLLQIQKPALITAVIANPDTLSQDIFPPNTTNPIDLCKKSLKPPLPCTPPFESVPPLSHKVTPPVVMHNLPHNLLTTVQPSSAVSTISVNSLSTTQQPLKNAASPTEMEGPPPLLLPFS